jgi:hypothetical protein
MKAIALVSAFQSRKVVRKFIGLKNGKAPLGLISAENGDFDPVQ